MRWLVGINSAPAFDDTVAVIANVAPANLPGLGEPSDAWGPGWESNCTRRFTISDVSAVVLRLSNQAPGTSTAGLAIPRTLSTPACDDLTAPDTVPAWLAHDSAWTDDGVGLLRNVVQVIFDSTATGIERQAVLDSLNAIVIGGQHASEDEPTYFLRVSNAGSVSLIAPSVALLNRQPAVDVASPVLRGSPGYLMPRDGSGYQSWTLDPDSAAGDNWALEKIRAPMAWGCSVGSPNVGIAVFDEEAETASDINQNVIASPFGQPVTSGVPSHATRVASILAARGDNGAGMTGVMWRAGMRFTNGNVYRFNDALIDAASQGIKVVNASWWWNWTTDTVSPGMTDSLEKQLAANTTAFFARRLRHLAQLNRLPLMVVIAGNAPTEDARWSVLPALKDSFPDHVLVVGGSTQQNARWADASTGGLIDIVAPAEMMSLTGGTVSSTHAGTSYAAPLVAGVAGLLQAFDPSLTPQQLRSLIIAGAQSRGVAVPTGVGTSAPLLDAYGALRAAASRLGAPLCGNRVFSVDSMVFVERAEPIVEEIFKMTGTQSFLSVKHGGKRIDVGYSDVYERQSNGAWIRTRDVGDDPADFDSTYANSSASFLSYDRTTHDGTLSVRTAVFRSPGLATYEFSKYQGNTYVAPGPVLNVPLAGAPTWSCAVERAVWTGTPPLQVFDHYECIDSSYVEGSWEETTNSAFAHSSGGNPAFAMYPDGSAILFPLTMQDVVQQGVGSGFGECATNKHRPDGFNLQFRCRGPVSFTRSPRYTRMLRISLTSSSLDTLTLFTVPGASVGWAGIADDAREVVMGSSPASTNYLIQWDVTMSGTSTGPAGGHHLITSDAPCRTSWRALRSAGYLFDRPGQTIPVGSPLRPETTYDLDEDCGDWWEGHAATAADASPVTQSRSLIDTWPFTSRRPR